LLFDLAGLWWICNHLEVRNKIRAFTFGLLNFAYFYNTLIWNQVDGILAFLLFASVILAVQRRLTASIIIYLLALNFKIQGIVLLPLLGLLWLLSGKWKVMIKAVIISIFIQFIILLPILILGQVGQLWAVITTSVDYYPSISMN